MKKLIFFTIVLFFSTSLFISCTTDEGDDINSLTARGKTMTDEWNIATDVILDCYADIPFKLHQHIKNSQHNIIEDCGSDIQFIDNGIWEIYVNGELSYLINTNGQPLDSIGSQWELTALVDYNDFGLRQNDSTINFTTTCIDTNSWNICSINKDIPKYFFDVNISCQTTPNKLNYYAMEFSGEANLLTSNNGEYIDLHFKTETDLQKTPYYWSGGIINIYVQNKEEKTSSTRAEFLHRNSEYITIITYGGITEEWTEYGWYLE